MGEVGRTPEFHAGSSSRSTSERSCTSSAHRLGAARLRPRNLTSLGKLRGPLMQGQPRVPKCTQEMGPWGEGPILTTSPQGGNSAPDTRQVLGRWQLSDQTAASGHLLCPTLPLPTQCWPGLLGSTGTKSRKSTRCARPRLPDLPAVFQARQTQPRSGPRQAIHLSFSPAGLYRNPLPPSPPPSSHPRPSGQPPLLPGAWCTHHLLQEVLSSYGPHQVLVQVPTLSSGMGVKPGALTLCAPAAPTPRAMGRNRISVWVGSGPQAWLLEQQWFSRGGQRGQGSS